MILEFFLGGMSSFANQNSSFVFIKSERIHKRYYMVFIVLHRKIANKKFFRGKEISIRLQWKGDDSTPVSSDN